jgi:hypothetical protein
MRRLYGLDSSQQSSATESARDETETPGMDDPDAHMFTWSNDLDFTEFESSFDLIQ